MAHAIPVDYLGRLLRTFGEDDLAETASLGLSVSGLIVGLSERELEVLHLLAAGKPNREIAKSLYVSTHTVKKHVTHIQYY